MVKDEMIRKLEETLSSMREALAKNEGSTIQTLATSLKSVFDTAKTNVLQNETTQKIISESRKYLGEFEKSVKSGDQKLSATLIDKAQKLLEEYKARKKE